MKKRYFHEIVSWDLPKKTERSIYLGKIAEAKLLQETEAYLPIDELCKHMIIAGSTGGGKTITAQIIAEEALAKNISTLVVDPTAQWTGIIKPLSEESIKKRYELFGMKKDSIRGYPARILTLDSGAEINNIGSLLKPGEITILNSISLAEKDIDAIAVNIVEGIFRKVPAETQELNTLIFFEEIHRILPKYGGTGKGLIALERAVREFRKWGIGIILISQVLDDFAGEIRANIGTEMQLRTSYEFDLNKIRLKYGDAIAKAVVREETGTAMMHNSNYNIGQPFFILIRPPYHDVHKLPESDLKKYALLSEKIEKLEKQGLSEQDMLNIKMARKELEKLNFAVAELHLSEIKKN